MKKNYELIKEMIERRIEIASLKEDEIRDAMLSLPTTAVFSRLNCLLRINSEKEIADTLDYLKDWLEDDEDIEKFIKETEEEKERTLRSIKRHEDSASRFIMDQESIMEYAEEQAVVKEMDYILNQIKIIIAKQEGDVIDEIK